MDAIHDSFLYYTQVRWLSTGNVMIRFHDLLGEIQSVRPSLLLLVSKKKDYFCGLSLSYLSDIFELLNELDRKIQGSDSNVNTHTHTYSKNFYCQTRVVAWTCAGKHYNAVSEVFRIISHSE